MNFINSSNQVDMNYNQMELPKINTAIFNQPSHLSQTKQITQTSDFGLGTGMNESNIFTRLSNDNLINISNIIEPSSLNGTNLDDMNNSIQKEYKQRNKNDDNSSLIKSLTKEIINNLKENNMSLYDNTSLNSRKSKSEEDYSDDNKTSISTKNNIKKPKKNKQINETIENFIIGSENTKILPVSEQIGWTQWFFDECFIYNDFLILFIIYFVLSQEMIKDFFGNYFSSLNPDSEGKVGIQGIIIYGLILTISFMIIRKFFK